MFMLLMNVVDIWYFPQQLLRFRWSYELTTNTKLYQARIEFIRVGNPKRTYRLYSTMSPVGRRWSFSTGLMTENKNQQLKGVAYKRMVCWTLCLLFQLRCQFIMQATPLSDLQLPATYKST